jgi:SAM-dependent methyltransferase
MIRTKPWNLEDMETPQFQAVNNLFNKFFGPGWPQVPLRRWEYVAAVIFTGVLVNNRAYRVLEAGSGCSVFTPFLALNGFHVDSFDMGNKDQRVERNIRYKINDLVTEHNMDLRDIKFPNNHFEFVFCISAIEHVNAGRFATDPDAGDTGDDKAMIELARVLKPGGIMYLTTDYAGRYYPPPGLWDTGSHRIYDKRRIVELVDSVGLKFLGETQFDMDWSKLNSLEPAGYDYTTFAITLTK